MPIEFAPPAPDVQPFNIPAPQSTDPLQTLAQMQAIRTGGLQQQSAQLQLQQAQLQMKSNRALMDALAQGGGKFDQTYNLAAQSGDVLPQDLMALQQHQVAYQTNLANLTEKQNAILGANINRYRGGLEALLQSGKVDQPSLDALNDQERRLGTFESGQIQPITTPDPDYIRAHSNSLAMVDDLRKEATEEVTRKEKEATTAKTQQEVTAGAKAQLVSDLRTMPVDPQTGALSPAADASIRQNPAYKGLNLPPGPLTKDAITRLVESTIAEKDIPEYRIKSAEAAAIKAFSGMTPQQLDSQVDAILSPSDPMNAKTKALLRDYINQGDFPSAKKLFKDAYDQQGKVQVAKETAQITAPIKVQVAGQVAGATAIARADAAGLTEDDYNRAGEQYIRTGVMPSLGRDSITRAKIVKAGNQWARDNGLSPSDVITMQAAYAGDKESLKKFQAQRDQIVSFEQTAQKNLNLFLDLAAKIPDTGVPWLNTPIRNLSQSIVGSQNMAAVNAARQVANNEIAKVTSGGGLSGVLSDSARNEVASYNPQNATFAQTKAVAQILKQDMANRHGSMDATLSDIKARIGQTVRHVIQIGNKRYQYNGSGATDDLKNYTEIK